MIKILKVIFVFFLTFLIVSLVFANVEKTEKNINKFTKTTEQKKATKTDKKQPINVDATLNLNKKIDDKIDIILKDERKTDIPAQVAFYIICIGLLLTMMLFIPTTFHIFNLVKNTTKDVKEETQIEIKKFQEKTKKYQEEAKKQLDSFFKKQKELELEVSHSEKQINILLDNMTSSFKFMYEHISKEYDISIEEIKYIVELNNRSNTDLIGNAILWLSQNGSEKSIPYLEKMDVEKWKSFAQEAIADIKKRNTKKT